MLFFESYGNIEIAIEYWQKQLFLQNINLSYLDLGNANLSYSDLTGANLAGANLSKVNLTGTYLDSSIWLKSDMQNISLEQLEKANFKYIIIGVC